MSSAFHSGFGGVVQYHFDPMPASPDGQVAATIKKVREYIRKDANSGLIKEQAQKCGSIQGVWDHIKASLRFQDDEKTAEQLQIDDPRKADVVEVLIRPFDQALMIAMRGAGFEDCDGYTMYASCLLTALGIPCSMVTIAADGRRPHEFSHIYLACYPEGKRIPLDFSHGPYPGWEAPHRRIKEWPVNEQWTERVWQIAAPAALAYLTYLSIRKAAA